MTLLFVVLSVQPVVPVASKVEYSLKVALVVVIANTLGWMVYRAGQRKSDRAIYGSHAASPASEASFGL